VIGQAFVDFFGVIGSDWVGLGEKGCSNYQIIKLSNYQIRRIITAKGFSKVLKGVKQRETV
jgi:hypothetical protein